MKTPAGFSFVFMARERSWSEVPHLGGTEARLHTAPQGGLSPTCHLVYALSTDWTAAGQSGLRVPQHIQHRWPVRRPQVGSDRENHLTSAYKVSSSSHLRGALCQGRSCWARGRRRTPQPCLALRELGLASINGSHFPSPYDVPGTLPGASYRWTLGHAAQSYEVSSHFHSPSMFEDTKT